MNEEIFGPIIPVIKYKNMEDIKYYISHHKNPLALYVFSEDENFSEDIINRFWMNRFIRYGKIQRKSKL